MGEGALRTIFLAGTLFFLVVLAGMSVDSLAQVPARTAPLTDQVVAGKVEWQSRNCNDCHTILGIGGYYAPELTKVMDRRGAIWLQDWLKNPRAVDPQATMPDQRLSPAGVADLVAFFGWVARIDTNGWPPQPLAALGTGGAPAAALLMQQKGCLGCHAVAGQGAAGPGPDLTRIGAAPYDALPNTPEFLARWLDDPQAAKPGSTMPRIPLTAAERDALVEYLVSLK